MNRKSSSCLEDYPERDAVLLRVEGQKLAENILAANVGLLTALADALDKSGRLAGQRTRNRTMARKLERARVKAPRGRRDRIYQADGTASVKVGSPALGHNQPVVLIPCKAVSADRIVSARSSDAMIAS